jgi:hypothetical protein
MQNRSHLTVQIVVHPLIGGILQMKDDAVGCSAAMSNQINHK